MQQSSPGRSVIQKTPRWKIANWFISCWFWALFCCFVHMLRGTSEHFCYHADRRSKAGKKCFPDKYLSAQKLVGNLQDACPVSGCNLQVTKAVNMWWLGLEALDGGCSRSITTICFCLIIKICVFSLRMQANQFQQANIILPDKCQFNFDELREWHTSTSHEWSQDLSAKPCTDVSPAPKIDQPQPVRCTWVGRWNEYSASGLSISMMMMMLMVIRKSCVRVNCNRVINYSRCIPSFNFGCGKHSIWNYSASKLDMRCKYISVKNSYPKMGGEASSNAWS